MTQLISQRPRFATGDWLWPTMLVAAVGLVDATYLTYTHYAGELVSCSAQASCEEVLSSPFSTIGGAPIALFGALYYATMIVLSLLAMNGSQLARKAMFWLSLPAFGFSCYLVYLQLFVIHAICQFCMVSFAACTLLFFIQLGKAGASARPT
jgi:uncharacterized membrane protein